MYVIFTDFGAKCRDYLYTWIPRELFASEDKRDLERRHAGNIHFRHLHAIKASYLFSIIEGASDVRSMVVSLNRGTTMQTWGP